MSYPLVYRGEGTVQPMTQAEFSELANVVLEAFALEDGPGSIYTTDTPGANLTFIGSFYDTSLIGNVNEAITGTGVYVNVSDTYTGSSILYDVSVDYTGAAVYESATPSTASISIVARQFFQDFNTPTGVEPPQVAFLNLSNTAPIKLGIDALVDEIHQYLIDSEGPGSYILRSEVPNDGIWQNLGAVDDVFSSSLTNSNKFLFKKLYSTGDIPRVNRPLKFNGDGTLQRLNDIELSRFAKKIREKIVNTGIGTYRLAPTAPAAGTWLNVGSVRDTRQRISGTQSVSYSLDYTGATNTFAADSYDGTNYGGTAQYNSGAETYLRDLNQFISPGINTVYEGSNTFLTTDYLTGEVEYQGTFAEIVYVDINNEYTTAISGYNTTSYVTLESYTSREITEYTLSYTNTYGGEPVYVNIDSNTYAGYVLAYTSTYTGPILYTLEASSYSTYTSDVALYSGPGTYTNPPATYTHESYSQNFYAGDIELSYTNSLATYLGQIYSTVTEYTGSVTGYNDNAVNAYTGGTLYTDENSYASGINDYASVSTFTTALNYTSSYVLEDAYLSDLKEYLTGEFSGTLIFDEEPSRYEVAVYTNDTYTRDPENTLYTGPGIYVDALENLYTRDDSEAYTSSELYTGVEVEYTLSYETTTSYTASVDYAGTSTTAFLGPIENVYQLSYSNVQAYTESTGYLESAPYTLEPEYDNLYTGVTLIYTEDIGIAYAIFLQPIDYTGGDTVYVLETPTPDYYERDENIYAINIDVYDTKLEYSGAFDRVYTGDIDVSYTLVSAYTEASGEYVSLLDYVGQNFNVQYTDSYQSQSVNYTNDTSVYTGPATGYVGEGAGGTYTGEPSYTGPALGENYIVDDIIFSTIYTAVGYLGDPRFLSADYAGPGGNYVGINAIYTGPETTFTAVYTNDYTGSLSYTSGNFVEVAEYVISFDNIAEKNYLVDPTSYIQDFNRTYTNQYENIYTTIDYTGDEYALDIYTLEETYTIDLLYDTATGYDNLAAYGFPLYSALNADKNTYTGEGIVEYIREDYYDIDSIYTLNAFYTGPNSGYVAGVLTYTGTTPSDDFYVGPVIPDGSGYNSPTGTYTGPGTAVYTGTIIVPAYFTQPFGYNGNYYQNEFPYTLTTPYTLVINYTNNNVPDSTMYSGPGFDEFISATALYTGDVFFIGPIQYTQTNEYTQALLYSSTVYYDLEYTAEGLFNTDINYTNFINYTRAVADVFDQNYYNGLYDNLGLVYLTYYTREGYSGTTNLYYTSDISYTLVTEYTAETAYNLSFVDTSAFYTGTQVLYTSTELNYSTDYNAYYTRLLTDYAGYNLSEFLSIPETVSYAGIGYITSYTGLQYTQDKYNTDLEYSGQVLYIIADPEYTRTYTTSVEYVGPTGVVYTGDIEYTRLQDFVSADYTGSSVDYVTATSFNDAYTSTENYNLLVNYTGDVDVTPKYTAEIAANETIINNDEVDGTEYILWRRIA